ncbi:hypothetical protein [Rhodococcus koreensis]|uniref:hypothetical protein n=1 Tax=Rhodococcus koreensis TaxID=99653 RepID=UPI003671691B
MAGNDLVGVAAYEESPGIPQPTDEVFLLLGVVDAHHDVSNSVVLVSALAIERNVNLQE